MSIVLNSNKSYTHIIVDETCNNSDIDISTDKNRFVIYNKTLYIYCTVSEERIISEDFIDKRIEYYVYGAHIDTDLKGMFKDLNKFFKAIYITLAIFILIGFIVYYYNS